jgi:hypothetical protein
VPVGEVEPPGGVSASVVIGALTARVPGDASAVRVKLAPAEDEALAPELVVVVELLVVPAVLAGFVA